MSYNPRAWQYLTLCAPYFGFIMIGSVSHLLCGTWHTADHDCDIVERRPHYLITRKKIHLFKKFQKVSKSVGFLNFVESRLYWNPFTFGIESRRFWKSRHGPSRFDFFLTKWISLVPNLALRKCPSGDHDYDSVVQWAVSYENSVQRKPLQLIKNVPLKLHLFCEFMEPLVSEFRGGSEFLTRNCIWEWFSIQQLSAYISRRQSM